MSQFEEPVPAFGLTGSQREKSRESIFLGATLHYEGAKAPVTTRVRNISAGGMMVDTTVAYAKGHRVVAEVKGIGEVNGAVAWSTDNRIGIVFDQPIDPKMTRQQVKSDVAVPGYNKPYIADRRPGLAIR
jgi:hypothetical protein